MRVLSEIIKNLTNNLKSGNLFPTIITITFRPESRTCPRCGTRGKVLKTITKPVVTLAIGRFFARGFRYSCPRCGLVFGSEELKGLVPERCNIGYDMLAYVGEAFFLGSRDNEQIVDELRKRMSVCAGARSRIWQRSSSFTWHSCTRECRRKQEPFSR